MPKPLLPVLERALRRFENDTGVKPRRVYVTPKQRAQLVEELRLPLGSGRMSVLNVEIVEARQPKAARIRALLPEQGVADVTTLSRPGGAGMEAVVRAFGRQVNIPMPARFPFRSHREPQPSMTREEVFDIAAKHFADSVRDEAVLCEEIRLRPVRPLQRSTPVFFDTVRNRGQYVWYDEESLLNTAISTSTIPARSIELSHVWTTSTGPSIQAQAITPTEELLNRMRATYRDMLAERSWAAPPIDPALIGLTESATARRETSAGTPESPQPTLRSPSRVR